MCLPERYSTPDFDDETLDGYTVLDPNDFEVKGLSVSSLTSATGDVLTLSPASKAAVAGYVKTSNGCELDISAGAEVRLSGGSASYTRNIVVYGTLELYSDSAVANARTCVTVKASGVLYPNYYWQWDCESRINFTEAIVVENGGVIIGGEEGQAVFAKRATGIVTLDGSEYRAANFGNSQYGDCGMNLNLSNGSLVSGAGLSFGWISEGGGHRSSHKVTASVTGTNVSTIAVDRLTVGAGGWGSMPDPAKAHDFEGVEFVVADTTGSDASDLVVNSPIALFPPHADDQGGFGHCSRPNYGIIKSGTSTVEFTKPMTYEGTFEVDDGVAILSESAALPGAGVVLGSGELQLDGVNASTAYELIVSDDSQLTSSGKASLTVGSASFKGDANLVLGGCGKTLTVTSRLTAEEIERVRYREDSGRLLKVVQKNNGTISPLPGGLSLVVR